jgi:hypothetical protein
MYTVRSYQQIISQPRRFSALSFPCKHSLGYAHQRRSARPQERATHCSPMTKTRQDQKHPSSFNAETRTTAEIETPHTRNIRQQINTISSYPTLYLYSNQTVGYQQQYHITSVLTPLTGHLHNSTRLSARPVDRETKSHACLHIFGETDLALLLLPGIHQPREQASSPTTS